MNTDINNLLKTDDGKPNESNKDNLSSKAPGSLNTITSLAKRFRSVFVVLYYINIVLITVFLIFASIGILSSRTPNAFVLLILIGGGVAYVINIFLFGFIATIIKIQEDLEKLAKK